MPLLELGFTTENNVNFTHSRAPIRAVVHGDKVRLIYTIGQDFLSSIIVDVDNTKHELLMGLTDMKKVLEKLGVSV